MDKGIGDDVQAKLELVTKARMSLIDSGLLVKEFCTAENLLERRKGLVRFSRGSAKLDTFLNGGIETQAVTEIAVANLTATSYDDIFDAYRSALEFYHHKSD
jgi:hypothetical protein